MKSINRSISLETDHLAHPTLSLPRQVSVQGLAHPTLSLPRQVSVQGPFLFQINPIKTTNSIDANLDALTQGCVKIFWQAESTSGKH